MRPFLRMLVPALCFAGSGCALIEDSVRNTVLGVATPIEMHREAVRNRQWAEAAWAQVCGADGTGIQSTDYAQGFKDGFAEYLLRGGDGEPPLVPPARYRHIRYQTPEGYAAIGDWFAGYRRGTTAAKTGGARQWITGPSSLQPSLAGVIPHEDQPPPMPPPMPPPIPTKPEPEKLPPPRVVPEPPVDKNPVDVIPKAPTDKNPEETPPQPAVDVQPQALTPTPAVNRQPPDQEDVSPPPLPDGPPLVLPTRTIKMRFLEPIKIEFRPPIIGWIEDNVLPNMDSDEPVPAFRPVQFGEPRNDMPPGPFVVPMERRFGTPTGR